MPTSITDLEQFWNPASACFQSLKTHSILLLFFLCLILHHTLHKLFCGPRVWTQGRVLARQVLTPPLEPRPQFLLC
jgi:hypothetical protein